jgi:predicted membrane-bound spermidine synthase
MSTVAKTETESRSASVSTTHGTTMTPVAPAAAKRAAWALYLIVVVSGAVLMGIEIAGAKILAPGFGTSTFVWGSIIGLFMGALAAGYYIGGKFADRNPEFGALAMVVSLAGVWVALIPRMGPLIADLIARSGWGVVMGPLAAATAIFFVPSFLMAMVSPFAVKLRATSLSGLGSIAGNLYALSTFGSIVGTMLTTFVLIPLLFVSVLMQILGVALVLVAAVSYILFRSAVGGIKPNDQRSLAVMVVTGLLIAEAGIVYPVQPHVPKGERLLRYEDSTYHEILVTENVIMEGEADGGYLRPAKLWTREGDNIPPWLVEIPRYLKFNENTESGIFPYNAEYANAVQYTDLLHLPLIFVNNPLPARMLVVGGGGGIIPTQYNKAYGTKVDIAEIDDKVREISQKYFTVTQDTDPSAPNYSKDIHFFIGDGRQTIKNLPDNQYDVIVLDAYSSGGQVPFHLMTWEFMREVKKKLTKHGVLATNIISALKNGDDPNKISPASLFLAEYKTLTATEANAHGKEKSDNPDENVPLFKKNQLYVFQKVRGGYDEYRNVIIVATQEETQRDADQLLSDVKRLTGGSTPIVKIPHLVEFVERGLYTDVRENELIGVPVLSDDYAPVDTMYRPVRVDETWTHY